MQSTGPGVCICVRSQHRGQGGDHHPPCSTRPARKSLNEVWSGWASWARAGPARECAPSGLPHPASPALPSPGCQPGVPYHCFQGAGRHGLAPLQAEGPGRLLSPPSHLPSLWGSPLSQLKAGGQREREAWPGAPPCRPAWSSEGRKEAKAGQGPGGDRGGSDEGLRNLKTNM